MGREKEQLARDCSLGGTVRGGVGKPAPVPADRIGSVSASDLLGTLSRLADDLIELVPPAYYCTEGLNVTQLRGADIPEAVEEIVYGPTHGDAAMASAAPYYNPSLPLVLIPVGWPDYPPNTALTADGIRRVFFGHGRIDRPLPAGRTHGVRDYYLANSYQQYRVREGQIAEWITLGRPWLSYANETGLAMDASRNPDLAHAALQAADVDWSPYLGAGDVITPQRVQVVFVTPYGNLGPTPLGSSGAARRYDSSLYIEWRGRRIEFRDHRYCFVGCKPAADPTRGVDDITFGGGLNVILHELNHCLFRLPDRYEHDGIADTVGDYDLMSNSENEKYMTIYDRMKIGWLRPPILRVGELGQACYSLPPSEAFPAAIVLYSDASPDEYWIVENRDARFDPFGFDGGLPDSGLAIWWVEAASGRLALVQADNPTAQPLANVKPFGPQLFKGSRFGAPIDFRLTPQHGSSAIQVSRVSPAGNPMRVQL